MPLASPAFTLRPAVPNDALAVTGILHTCANETDTVDEVRSWLGISQPGRIDRHLAAVDEAGALLGYGNILHPVSAPAGFFYTWVGVLPPHRCRGIGAALWNALEALLREHGARQAAADVLEGDPAGLAFAQARGFTHDRHKFRSSLSLAGFDETPYLPLIAALEAQGIRFTTLADLPGEEAARQYYELNLATVRDIPGEYWDFSQYRAFFDRWITGAPWFRPEGQLLAVAGDTLAGFASVRLLPEERAAHNATTGVLPAYRGRGIGLALKVLAIRYARACGMERITTNNDSLNAPILAINRRLGYQPEPGKFWLVRALK